MRIFLLGEECESIAPCKKVVEGLKRVRWEDYGVVYAVLFGSASLGCEYRDVDLAVLFDSNPSVSRLIGFIMEVAGSLGISGELVDVTVLNHDYLPCGLIEGALGEGVPVYYRDYSVYIRDVLERLWNCWDYEIVYYRISEWIDLVLKAKSESMDFAYLRRSLENRVEAIEYTAMRIDREIEKGYDLSDWGERMKFLHALQVLVQSAIELVLELSGVLGYYAGSPLDAGRYLLREGIMTKGDFGFFRVLFDIRTMIVSGYPVLWIDSLDNILRKKMHREVVWLAYRVFKRATEYMSRASKGGS